MRYIGPTALIAAISGFACVGLSAFGEHALTDPQAKHWVETAMRYHALHTMAALASISFRNWGAPFARFAPWFFFSGIVLFPGTLYALAFGAPRNLAILAPIGGVAMMAGWAVLAWAAFGLIRRPIDAGPQP